MHSPVSRVAAATILVVAFGGVALWFHTGGATPAAADFLKPILDAKGVRFKMTTETRDPYPTVVTTEAIMLDDGRARWETTMPNGQKQMRVSDPNQGRTLFLTPASKEATVLTYDNPPNQKGFQDPLAGFRKLLLDARDKPGVQREPLGEKEIDGRRVVGVRIAMERGVLDVWGDPKTGEPVRIDITSRCGGDVVKQTWSDFDFNVNMDKSLFSLEPPAGYTVRTEKGNRSPLEGKDLIEMFRDYSKSAGGPFPDSLNSRIVSFAFWKRFNTQTMWEQVTQGNPRATEKDRREFVRQMNEIMDAVAEDTAAGRPIEEQSRKMSSLVQKLTRKFAPAMIAQQFVENVGLPGCSEEQRQKLEELVRQSMDGNGKPNEKRSRELAEEMTTIAVDAMWDEIAPAKWKTNSEKKSQFEKLMHQKLTGKLDEKQWDDVKKTIRDALGSEALKRLEACNARTKEIKEARKAKTEEAAKARAAESRWFMEAQRQVQRGLRFANNLPSDADAHYVGKGVLFGTPDTPIFWYRPKDAKTYRVIYADLSVRESDTPPDVPNAQPVPVMASPER